jgi:hypothetical protein
MARPCTWITAFVVSCASSLSEQAWAGPNGSSGRAPGEMTHDGFYLRFGTGFGAYDERANSETTPLYDGRLRARSRGFAVASEFAMGGTPWKGLVIGGGLYTLEVYTSSVTTNKNAEASEEIQQATKDIAIESRDLSIIGPFIDRYFVPEYGLHVQAALGIAAQYGFTVNTPGPGGSDYNPVGPGFILGLGYESWITNQWSLGILARFGAGALFGKDDNDVVWAHYIVTLPTFLMTVTYH